MSKSEADWCKKIEVWWLLRDIKQRGGYKKTKISWGTDGANGSILAEVSILTDKYVRFTYIQGGTLEFNYKIPLIEIPCHFGGTRYWFKCPLYKNGVYCGRRVGVLYKDGDWFGCRHCYGLTYMSRNTNRKWRYHPATRALEIDTKLEELYMKMKRSIYGGKPTKIMLRIQKLESQFKNISRSI